MTIEDRVQYAKNDKGEEERILKEYIPFVLSCAKRTLNCYITKEDDEFSIAIFAFYEAMQKYSDAKGSFLSFARIVIHNRLVDYLRKEQRQKDFVPFSSLVKDDDGNLCDLEIPDLKTQSFDAKYEIEMLTYDLKKSGISFFDIAKSSPKSKKTKEQCFMAIDFISNNKILANNIKEKGYMPIKAITDLSSINKKILERHRNYIIAAVLIKLGDYEIISEYIKPTGKEVI